jgi:hypothetical protein
LQANDPPDANKLDAAFERGVVIVAGLSCVALSFLVYWPIVHDYFVWDDFFFLRAVRNHSFPVVVQRAFTFPEAKPFDEVTLFWRPLTDFYFYGMRAFGLHPEPYHIVNLLLHGVVAVLGMLLVRRLTGSLAGGVATAFLFVVAPTYDIAVTWIAEVSEILGAAFIVGALLAYQEFLAGPTARGRAYVVTLVLTALALLTKESTVILMALLPALAVTVERRRSWREIGLSLVPLIAIGAAFAAVMLAREYLEEGDTYELGSHMIRNVRDYLKWQVFPYNYGAHDGLRTVAVIAFVVIGVLAAVLRERILAFFAFWAVIALLPFSGFVFGIELRYEYLSTLPFIAFVVSSATRLLAILPHVVRRPAGAVLAVAVLVAVLTSSARTRDAQEVLTYEADGYENMVNAVQQLCGPMPAESHIFVVQAPYHDLFGLHTPAAINLFYDRVYAGSVPEVPGLIGFVKDKCVLQAGTTVDGYRLLERTP